MIFKSNIEGNLTVMGEGKEIVFINGEYETTDKDEMELLKAYATEEIKEEIELTRAQIMELLDGNVEYNKRATKAELLEVLNGWQAKQGD